MAFKNPIKTYAVTTGGSNLQCTAQKNLMAINMSQVTIEY